MAPAPAETQARGRSLWGPRSRHRGRRQAPQHPPRLRCPARGMACWGASARVDLEDMAACGSGCRIRPGGDSPLGVLSLQTP